MRDGLRRSRQLSVLVFGADEVHGLHAKICLENEVSPCRQPSSGDAKPQTSLVTQRDHLREVLLTTSLGMPSGLHIHCMVQANCFVNTLGRSIHHAFLRLTEILTQAIAGSVGSAYSDSALRRLRSSARRSGTTVDRRCFSDRCQVQPTNEDSFRRSQAISSDYKIPLVIDLKCVESRRYRECFSAST